MNKLKRYINKLLSQAGYVIIKNDYKAEKASLYDYKAKKGKEWYDYYVKVQSDGNKKKIENSWAQQENIRWLAGLVKKQCRKPTFGICHGTRRGEEQRWFSEELGINVLGTEISETAINFENTIQWDFHEVKNEWIAACDFIYSNALDHSYDPSLCLNRWMICLKDDGVCILEHSSGHENSNELDPFGASIELMPSLVLDWGQGRFCVTEILEAKTIRDELDYLKFLILRKNPNPLVG